MAQLEIQRALSNSLPSGFQSTLMESDRLRKLQQANVSNLTDTVEDYGSSDLKERDEIQRVVDRVRYAYTGFESTLELPGTSLEMENQNLFRFASRYKQDNDTPSGTIKGPEMAGTDDIVFCFANPQVYGQISGNSTNNFIETNLSAGTTHEVVGDNGIDYTNNSNGSSLSLAADEWMYFTGDYIDLSEGQSKVSKVQVNDVDSEDYNASSALFNTRASGAHIITAQGAMVQSTVDIDAKVYEDGDVELVPVAFYMGPGTKVPSLT